MQTSLTDIELPAPLALVPGALAQIEFDAMPGRHGASVVGFEENKYLILRLSSPADIPVARLIRGSSCAIRYIHGGKAYGFNTHGLGTFAIPDRLFCVAWPRIVAERNLREVKRVECALPAELVGEEEGVGIVVRDLSVLGLGLVYRLEPEETDQTQGAQPDGAESLELPSRFENGAELSVRIAIPGEAERLELQGLVCSSQLNRAQKQLSLGLQFVEPAAESQAKLEALIEQLS
jgi:hypothetical protein